jgi:lipopolysaccharide export system ATP-binding protein
LEVIKSIILNLQSKGVSVLITDHNAQNVLSIVDRCSIIYDGQIVTSGTPKQILSNQKAREIYFGKSFDF